MRELILAIRDALRGGLDSTVFRPGSRPDEGDIFIAEDIFYLPTAVKLPAVGIKDGADELIRRYACGDAVLVEEHNSTVQIVCWSPSDGTLIGGGVIGDQTQPGVLDIARMIHAILSDNLLCIEGIQGVERGPIAGSAISNQAGRIVQNITVPYIYNREVKQHV